MNNTFFRILFCVSFILSSSCGKGRGLSSNVGILHLPFGKGDVKQPRRPHLSYSSESEEVPCRPQQPDLQDIRDYNNDFSVISKIFQEKQRSEQNSEGNQRAGQDSEGNQRAGQDSEGNQRSGKNQPVYVSVKGGWIKLGFYISNNNKGEGGKPIILKIDRLEIHGRGNCEQEGQPPCSFNKTISSGYCGLSFLYLVSSKDAVIYQPLSPNPLWNLSIYVGDIPVIDSSKLPERENRLPGGATLILPQYQIQVLFIGEFLLEDGQTLEPFRKRIGFSTGPRQAF